MIAKARRATYPDPQRQDEFEPHNMLDDHIGSREGQITLTVIIVNWNTKSFLARCLHSLSVGFERKSVGAIEVVVVDNASSDGSVHMVQDDFPWVRLIQNNENVGFARANNQALRTSKGRYVLLLNSDTEVRDGALGVLMKSLETREGAGAAGPLLLDPDGRWQNSYGTLPSVCGEIIGPYRFDFITKPWGRFGRYLLPRAFKQGQCFQVERVSFACTMISRDALEAVGLLDECYEFYSEDYDWFFRLKVAGWKAVFCPSAQVVHHWGGSSSQRSEWAIRQLYRSKRLYFLKHNGKGAASLFSFALAMKLVLKFFILSAFRLISPNNAHYRSGAERSKRLFQDMLKPM